MSRDRFHPDAQGDLAEQIRDLVRRVRDIETGAQTIRDRKCDEALAKMNLILELFGQNT